MTRLEVVGVKAECPADFTGVSEVMVPYMGWRSNASVARRIPLRFRQATI